ncbi:hypothetical protein XELAEV_18006357mg [Xenopus laevis]|uniref:Uncharacterized protein n=1 Tax=Xenopus laevis TaxID=8355 RepID=A0A974I452_XENLA|nr:hypothetical protein XELAEV_18006357mg [Xenopus laevis]
MIIPLMSRATFNGPAIGIMAFWLPFSFFMNVSLILQDFEIHLFEKLFAFSNKKKKKTLKFAFMSFLSYNIKRAFKFLFLQVGFGRDWCLSEKSQVHPLEPPRG